MILKKDTGNCFTQEFNFKLNSGTRFVKQNTNLQVVDSSSRVYR